MTLTLPAHWNSSGPWTWAKPGLGGLWSSELLEGGKAAVLPCLSLFLEKCWGGGAEETFCSSWASSPPWQTSCLSRSLSPPSQSMKPEVLKCLAQELTCVGISGLSH